MAGVILQSVSRRFGATQAVIDVDLAVAEGAFVSLLGPSGCGKTTLLRLVAGLELPDRGRIWIGGRPVVDDRHIVLPEDRGLAMVFQSYALWPQMDVAGNVGFALSVQGVRAAERRARVAAALDRVGLAAYAHRRPSELSGGQRQRVALARALAMRTRLILLDEPLANLDAHLRDAMLTEFSRLHRETGATFLYVTHDQAEAMALSTQIAVMEGGQIRQMGAPEELWRQPSDEFVARFVGGGAVVPVEVLARMSHGRSRVRLWGTEVSLRGEGGGGARWAALRPTGLRPAAQDEPAFPARIESARYRGGGYMLTVRPLVDPSVELSVPCTEPPAAEVIRVTVEDGWLLPNSAQTG